MKKILLVSTMLCIAGPLSFSQTIAEKMASAAPKSMDGPVNFDGMLKDVNTQLTALRTDLDSSYQKARALHAEGSKEEEFKELLVHVNAIKEQIQSLESKWHDAAVGESKREEEGYALWDQEETTLAQLVMEYGALDYLFIVPPEMAALKLNMHSNIPIPRESWNEMLEIILSHNGIGVKKINTYVRQLYILKQDPSAIQAIASSPAQLQWIPDRTRLFYVFTPPVEQVKSSFQFFERFADAKQTFIYQIGPKIAIISTKEEVNKLIDLYNTVWTNSQGKVSRVVPVNKMGVREMERILQSFFGEAIEKNRAPFGKIEQEGLNIFSLGQGNALILIGQEEVVARAEKIVKETEEQLQDPAEMTVYMYQCRHSNPEDLSKVLEKVYNSLLSASTEGNKELDLSFASQGPQFKTPIPDGYPPQNPPLVVAPPPLKTGNTASLEVEQGNDHFIADPKTGNLLMVVRRDALVKIKDLLRKLDVPKKMVQIEVMLFEKRIKNENSYGMNMLKIGSKKNHLQFKSDLAPRGPGVLEFLIGHGKSKHFPAYDLALNFLMTQEDIQLNAAPSVITVNQTAATISIVEEISVNNGAAPVDTNKGIAFEKSFSRNNYGIIINMTPTVHMPDNDDPLSEGKGFVTLQTNVTFDTTRNVNNDDRPLVDRRHIENEVRVLDGQTVILGGLRRKTSHDNEEKVPFLGDIPGIGKLFGSMRLSNHNTEMFIFITPTIVLDPEEQLIQIRTEEVKKRPGDIPEYLQRVVESQEKERKKYFQNSFKALFGNSNV
ncbi:MAG: type II secretion system protein GspD [Candidatus Melainabacteria bacterium]|nr:type II secretion system protein GspD [Candidatus Melainabacteria bacterium]